jgi:DNA-binding MarR family transcriptional regulator
MTPTFDPNDSTHQEARRFLLAISTIMRHVAASVPPPAASPLNTSQLYALFRIMRDPGITQTALADQMNLTTAAISSSVREMEVQGMIERRPNPVDARSMQLYLAPQGQQVFDRLFGTVAEVIDDLLSALPEADREHLIDSLEQVLAAKSISFDSASSHCQINPLKAYFKRERVADME